ncbi:hypothetical protein J2X11_001010 [Aeromicrobium panaciterrae]|uniref:Uncharacterized protein n=1 Tax=Aeromicrobium panaciterrae TaxID=363861 RepID=A0ABU1ULX1_9ACTN|nr:hypothetical protein [Aeromicrobium panaciterrae]MDR7086171.1 hypothetical protein [Aeromicrobium panaciterrae]
MSFVASRSKVGPADTITLSGAFSDKVAGLEVELQSSTRGSAFEPTGQATITDSSGAYTFSYKPGSRVKTSLRVVLVNGDKTVVSRELAITVLEATAIKSHLEGPTEVALDEKVTVIGTVSPAELGRAVTLEATVDGTTWVSVGAPVTTANNGSFTLRAPTTNAGAITVRATVLETPQHAAASGKPMNFFVIDHEAAAHYLSCVKPANEAGDALNTAISRHNAGAISWSALKKATTVYAQGLDEEIRCLKNYSWPSLVAGLISDLARQEAVVYDATKRALSAKTSATYLAAFGTDFRKAGDRGASDGAKIRRGLGLPASTD